MTIKNYSLSILVLVFPFILSAQSVFRIDDMKLDTNHNISFGIRSEAFVNSTALSGKATSAGLFGGYITPEERQFMLDRAAEYNNVGQFLNTSVYFAHRIDTLFGKERSQLSYFINVSDRQESNSLFTKNALNLVLFGNKQFSGDTIEYGTIGVNQLRYNQIQFGINKSFKSDVQFGVGISFLYGQNNQQAYAPTLDIYTEQNGYEISGIAEVQINQTDPNNSQSFAYNGAGASIDISGDFPISIFNKTEKEARFKAAVYDLGFISWNGTSTELDLDGEFEYSGIHIENVFNNENNTNNELEDYVDSLFTTNKKPYVSYTPVTLMLELKQEFSKSEISLGFMYRHFAYYSAFLYGKYGHDIGEHWSFAGQLNYGGYGKFGGGLEIKYIGETMDVKLGSTNIEGFLNPTKWAGQSVYVLIGFKI